MYRIITITAVSLLTICSGCNKNPSQAINPVASAAHGDNRHYERLIAGQEVDGDRAAEARAWLNPKNTQNVLWKTTRAQTMQFVDDLYEAGALNVYAVYAPSQDGSIPVNACAELFIVLPSDANTRKKVFRTYNRIDKEIWGPDHEPAKDDGRKYLDLNMDP